MTNQPRLSAVFYAKDMDRVASFYAAVLGLAVGGRDEEHVWLASAELDLVVRQMSGAIAASINIAEPPVRRAHSAVKLVFFVRSIAVVRAAATAHGGVLDAVAKEWLFNGHQVWDGLDPEGNVIQFRAPAAV
jgi:predicted enzyme related to lactoylglutathione lyase